MNTVDRRTLLVCWAALAASGAAHGQTNSTPPTDVEASSTELDYVMVEGTRLRDEVTLGRTGTTLRETPQSVTIMGQARIEAQNLRNLDEVLIQTPGIILLADSTVENTYTARGHIIESIQYDNITTGTNPET